MENLGRVNYSYKIESQRKGIDGAVVVNNHLHFGWEAVCLDESALKSLNSSASVTEGAPGVYDLTFDVAVPADTFLNLTGWGKGTVFLNEFCLGRFWEIGPQRRLYIPALLLKPGANALRIIETEGHAGDAALIDAPPFG